MHLIKQERKKTLISCQLICDSLVRLLNGVLRFLKHKHHEIVMVFFFYLLVNKSQDSSSQCHLEKGTQFFKKKKKKTELLGPRSYLSCLDFFFHTQEKQNIVLGNYV